MSSFHLSICLCVVPRCTCLLGKSDYFLITIIRKIHNDNHPAVLTFRKNLNGPLFSSPFLQAEGKISVLFKDDVTVAGRVIRTDTATLVFPAAALELIEPAPQPAAAAGATAAASPQQQTTMQHQAPVQQQATMLQQEVKVQKEPATGGFDAYLSPPSSPKRAPAAASASADDTTNDSTNDSEVAAAAVAEEDEKGDDDVGLPAEPPSPPPPPPPPSEGGADDSNGSLVGEQAASSFILLLSSFNCWCRACLGKLSLLCSIR